MSIPTDSAAPFWRSGRMQGESLLFVASAPDGPATSSLLVTTPGPVLLQSATGEFEYVEGVDYALDAASGLLTRTPGSRLPMMTLDQLHPLVDPDGSGFMHRRGNRSVFLLVNEGDLFHRLQASASYSFDTARWTGYSPQFSASGVPRTLARLRQREGLTICLLGDSISEGYNASGFVGAPPYRAAYGALVAAGLERAYQTPVTLRNFATAGWTSDDGLGAIDAIGAVQPDLVLIAFGMNDAGYADAAYYAANIRAIVEGIRGAAPLTEFVLVSSMLPNPEWHYPQTQRFVDYQPALAELCGPGIILADVTALWTDVMMRKRSYDLTGNGINHPNDFGHSLYSQAILSLLVE